MTSAKVTIEGLDALKHRLEKALPEAIRRELGVTMVRSAARVVRDAQALVPIASGQLKSTIRHTEPRVSAKTGALYVTIMAGGTTTEVGEAKNFQLARIVEYGAQGRPAEPFFRPAWRRNKRGVRLAMSKALDRAVIKSK